MGCTKGAKSALYYCLIFFSFLVLSYLHNYFPCSIRKQCFPTLFDLLLRICAKTERLLLTSQAGTESIPFPSVVFQCILNISYRRSMRNIITDLYKAGQSANEHHIHCCHFHTKCRVCSISHSATAAAAAAVASQCEWRHLATLQD